MAGTKADLARGGRNVPKEKRSFYKNRQLASECGRKGGLRAQENRRLKILAEIESIESSRELHNEST